MNNLPEYVLFEIFSFLSEKDLVNGPSQVCKDFRSIINCSDYLLSTITKNSLGLQSDFRIDHALFQQIFNKIYSSTPVDLSFKGFATTGGYDEDNMTYWVGNLYKDDGTYYCSRDNKLNITTAGVLEAALLLEQEKEENCDYILRILREIELISNSLHPRFKKHHILSPGVKRGFINLYTIYRNEVIHIVSESFQESPQLVAEKLKNEIKGIKVDLIDSVKIRKRPEDKFFLQDSTDTAMADKSKTKAVITMVSVSREGGFTCPLETFIVLCSEKFIDLESEEFIRYNDMLTFEKLQSTFPGEVSELNSTNNSLHCTFTHSNQNLKPLAWGKFTSPQQNVIEIPLPYKTVGNYLYLKMINPENRMAQMNDNHDFPNIDCNYLIAKGHVVSFNT